MNGLVEVKFTLSTFEHTERWAEMSGDERRYLTVWRDLARFFLIGIFEDTGECLIQVTKKNGKPENARLIVPTHWVTQKSKKKIDIPLETFFGMTKVQYREFCDIKLKNVLDEAKLLMDSYDTFHYVFSGLFESFDEGSDKPAGSGIKSKLDVAVVNKVAPEMFARMDWSGKPPKNADRFEKMKTLDGRLKIFNETEKLAKSGRKLSFADGFFEFSLTKS